MNKILTKRTISLSVSILILIFLLIVICSITYKAPMKRKLMGFWNIEVENTDWLRDSVYYFLDYNIHFAKDTINLPPVNGDIPFYEILQKAKGIWKIISTNPDTVFFNVPNNPLHGKYAIRFFIDKKGYGNAGNNIYKIELQNDSTYLTCNKGGIISSKEIRDWEGKN